MKKALSIVLVAALTLSLFGCAGRQTGKSTSENTYSFYYCLNETEFGTESGVFAPELRTVSDPTSLDDILREYLTGPSSAELYSPVPQNVSVISAQLVNSCVEVMLSDEYISLTGVNRTIANACLTMTLLQYPEAESVSICTQSGSLSSLDGTAFTAADFATYDFLSESVEISLKVYFSDASYRYLLSTTHRVNAGQIERLPEYVIDLLVTGPTDDVMRSVVPDGTKLLSSEIIDDVCTLNFNQAFYDNRPVSETTERLLIYSIVNSVTGIAGIETVRFEIEGEPAGLYRYMDLSLEYSFEEDTVGPVRESMNEIDTTIYMVGYNTDRLTALPLRVRQNAGETSAEALMADLLVYDPPTGVYNPIPYGTTLLGVTTEGIVCRVDLSDDFLTTDNELAIRSIVLTLCSLPGIYRVQIMVEGEPCTSILQPDMTWTYPNT